MRWMCAECGKPHPRNDPPCDNCGAVRFEQTVTRELDPSEYANVDWRCTNCGRHHVKNSPPCSRCGGMRFEPIELDDLDPGDVSAGYTWFDLGRYVAVILLVLVLVGFFLVHA